MLSNFIISTLTLLAAAPAVQAHSWVEALYRIDSTGAFDSKVGYPIGYLPRSAGVGDDQHQVKITDTKGNPAVCKPSSMNNYDKFPPLQAGPGDFVAMQYQENGHVTAPDLTPRPYRSGNVYVYGTSEHQDSDGINDVLGAWTADGKGGNGKGRLLATHFYDDGQCFQNRGADNAIFAERSEKFGMNELYCQTDFQLPEDLPTDGTYTVMWVWDYPLIQSDTENVTEIYSTCADIQLGQPSKANKHGAIKFAQDNKVSNAGIASQVNELIEATGPGVGFNKPAAPTGLDKPAAPTGGNKPTKTTHSPAGTATSSVKNGNGGAKTVTVTADAATVTEFKTVTVGNGSGNAPQTVTVTTTDAPDVAAPTSLVPVQTVEPFKLNARARVTGHARRG